MQFISTNKFDVSLCKAINKDNTLQQFMNTALDRITATSYIQQK